MNHAIDVLILDDDHFFAYGLRHCLMLHASRFEKTLRFIHHLHETTGQLFVFFSFRQATHLPTDLLLHPHQEVRLICIAKSRDLACRICPGLPHIPVLFRESLPLDIERLFNSDPQWLQRQPRLTAQEVRVLFCILHGQSIKMTARRLSIHGKSVSNHICIAMRKLGLKHTQALQLWLNGPGQPLLKSVAGTLNVPIDGTEMRL